MTDDRWTRALIEPPDFFDEGAEFVSLGQAKRQCRVTSSHEDELLRAYILAAATHLDASGGSTYQRALRPQTWELRLAQFPCATRQDPQAAIVLPYPPLIGVLSFEYDDADGVVRVLVAGAHFEVVGIGGRSPARLVPAADAAWPASNGRLESVRIRYRCGYGIETESGESEAGDTLPVSIRQAALLLIAHWYKHREEVVIGQTPVVMPAASEALMRQWRVF